MSVLDLFRSFFNETMISEMLFSCGIHDSGSKRARQLHLNREMVTNVQRLKETADILNIQEMVVFFNCTCIVKLNSNHPNPLTH